MAGITRRSLGDPEDEADFADHGDAAAAMVGDTVVWRSRLQPGWSWDDDIKPFVDQLIQASIRRSQNVPEPSTWMLLA